MAEEIRKCGSRFKHFLAFIPLVTHGATVLVVALAYISASRHVKEATSATVSSNMYASLDHVAAGMQAILAANHSAIVVADYLAATSNRNRLSHAEQNLFMAFAMQPHVAEMSYAGVDGSAFTYYRGKDGRPRKMFVSRRGKWYKQAADPVTGGPVGPVAAVPPPKRLPNAARALADAKSGSLVALSARLARPSVQMVVFSAPVGDAGVVSAAVPIKDVLPIADRADVGFGAVDAYYSITDTKHNASTGYKPLVVGSEAKKKKKMEDLFSEIKCTASAVDAPKLELHDVQIGSHHREYKVACTSFDVSGGVHLGLRLVWQKEAMFREIGVAVVSVVCLLAAMAAVACFFMARALWRSGSREVALQGDLMRQKEALQQAERKSMNKSNAFASASHDIRSSLAAVAGLIDVSRTEARANPNLTYYLDQMEIGTKKLFDILNTILDMSKVESGKMQLEEVQFSMADVLEESMDMANIVGMSRGVEVVWDPCDFSVLRCDAVIGDCKRFKQILDNLLGNAIKFTHDGHVVLHAWANRPIARTSMISTPSRFAPRWRPSVFYRWMLGTREDGAEQNARRLIQNDPNTVEFYFEVVDTGVGIPKEKRQSVFENYVQVKEGHGGTGLGLGIVQSFVRLMGGEISIKDKEPGEAGTCFGFNVFLKISDAEEDIEHGRAAPSLFREPGCFKGGQCVLLVHGDETRRILQTWMENVGMKVWPVPRAELLAPTMEKARAAVGASPSRPASISSSLGGSDDLDGVADRCFSSKEMVTQVLRNSNGNHTGHLHPFGLLLVVDVSGGRLNEILQDVASLARIKHQVPCRVACITDLKTSSEDLRRLKEAASCDMDLRKPIHGSRLRKLLQVMRELQASPFPQQHSHQVGIIINELPAADQATAASSEITYVAAVPQEPPRLGDDKPLEAVPHRLKPPDGSEAVAMFINALEIASGGAASEEQVALPYDLIFMDCQMPVMDGYEATKRIREEESHYRIHTPIIALTAHSEEDLQKTIQAGMDLHLTKPIQKEKVVEAVHQVWKEDN
ncbi:hypothetical protein ACQ4PT_000721 [Festuca glaucescens]